MSANRMLWMHVRKMCVWVHTYVRICVCISDKHAFTVFSSACACVSKLCKCAHLCLSLHVSTISATALPSTQEQQTMHTETHTNTCQIQHYERAQPPTALGLIKHEEHKSVADRRGGCAHMLLSACTEGTAVQSEFVTTILTNKVATLFNKPSQHRDDRHRLHCYSCTKHDWHRTYVHERESTKLIHKRWLWKYVHTQKVQVASLRAHSPWLLHP